MENRNSALQDDEKIWQSVEFWEKVIVVFFLLIGVAFLLGMNSLPAAFAEKIHSKQNTAVNFKETNSGKAVAIALPRGEKVPTTHNLGAKLGHEETVM